MASPYPSNFLFWQTVLKIAGTCFLVRVCDYLYQRQYSLYFSNFCDGVQKTESRSF